MAKSKNIIKSFNEFGGSMADTTANGEIKDGVNYFSGERGGYYFIFRGEDPLSNRDEAEMYLNTQFSNEENINNFLEKNCIFSCKVTDNGITEPKYNFNNKDKANIDKLNRIINGQNPAIGRNYVEITLSKALNIQNENSVDMLDKDCSGIFYRFNGSPTIGKIRDIWLNADTEEQFKEEIKKKINYENVKIILSSHTTFFVEDKDDKDFNNDFLAFSLFANYIDCLTNFQDRINKPDFKKTVEFLKKEFNDRLNFITEDKKQELLKPFEGIESKEKNPNQWNDGLKKLEEGIDSVKKEAIEELDALKTKMIYKAQVRFKNQYDNFFKELNEKVSNETQCSYIEYELQDHAILLKVERTNSDKIKIVPYDPSGAFSRPPFFAKNVSFIDGKTNYEVFLEYFEEWKRNNQKSNIEFASPEEVLNIKTPQGNQGFCSYHALAMAKTFADRDEYNKAKLDSLQDNKQITVLKNDLIKEAKQVMNKEDDEKLKDCYLKQINVLEKLNDTDKIKDFIIEHTNQAPFYIEKSDILMTDTQFECNRVVNTFLHSMSLSMINYHSPKNQTREDIRIPYNELGETVFKASMGDQEAANSLENDISNDYIKTNLQKIVGYLERYHEVIEDKTIKDKNEKLYLDDIDQGNGEKKRINGILSEAYLQKIKYNILRNEKMFKEDLKSYKFNTNTYNLIHSVYDDFVLGIPSDDDKDKDINQIKDMLNFGKINNILLQTKEIEFKESGYYDENIETIKNIQQIVLAFENLKMIDDLYNNILKQFTEKYGCDEIDKIEDFLKNENEDTKETFEKFKKLNDLKKNSISNINHHLNNISEEYKKKVLPIKNKSYELSSNLNSHMNDIYHNIYSKRDLSKERFSKSNEIKKFKEKMEGSNTENNEEYNKVKKEYEEKCKELDEINKKIQEKNKKIETENIEINKINDYFNKSVENYNKALENFKAYKKDYFKSTIEEDMIDFNQKLNESLQEIMGRGENLEQNQNTQQTITIDEKLSLSECLDNLKGKLNTFIDSKKAQETSQQQSTQQQQIYPTL